MQATYPPMSVPTPSGLPRRAMSAPSPPEEPPGVMYLFHGFVVRPKTWLYVSPHCARSARVGAGAHPEGLRDVRADEGHGTLLVEDLGEDAVRVGVAAYPASVPFATVRMKS